MTHSRLFVGDPAPWFSAATADNRAYSFASVAGRHVLLLFPGPADTAAAAATHAIIRQACAAGLFAPERAIVFTVSIDPADRAPAGPRDLIPVHRVFLDADQRISRLFGAAEAPLAFLLDPMLRVAAVVPIAALPLLLARIRDMPVAQPDRQPAPVLLLPDVFEPELRDRLIAQYERVGGEASGFMVVQGGRTVGRLDPRMKRRRDCEVTETRLQSVIRNRIARRVVPEIRKAFHFEVSRIERYLIACYSGTERGHFRAHRDDTTPATAHRRFAVTINLNEDFTGGELRFPEFGMRLWRPPAGGALVFSCRLLHEALPVTAGSRFACLPFLYDEAAEQIRLANLTREARLAAA